MSSIEPLAAGAKAPLFNFIYSDGTLANTADLAGKTYLVYFYPKDDTPGCTKEACAFRDLFNEFEAADITVIGVSGDSEKSHDKFRNKYTLPFPLAADTSLEIARAFGVYGEKKFMGRVYDGIHRISFLINPDGHVFKTYPKVKPEKHPEEVLSDVKEPYST